MIRPPSAASRRLPSLHRAVPLLVLSLALALPPAADAGRGGRPAEAERHEGRGATPAPRDGAPPREGSVRMEEVEVRGRAALPPLLPEPDFRVAPPPAPTVRRLVEEEASRPLLPPPPAPGEERGPTTIDRRQP